MSNLCNVKTNKSLGILVYVCDKLFENQTNYPQICNGIFFLIAALSSMSSSSFESQRSIRSSTSIQSAASYKSGMFFSINIDFWFPHTHYIYGLMYNLTEILFWFYTLAASNSSWFSIGSFSNFQAGGIVDPRAMNRAPRVSSFFDTV